MPAFKEQLGNWDADQTKAKAQLDAVHPVVVDASVFGDRKTDPRGYKLRARAAYKQLQSVHNQTDGKDIVFVMTGYRKMLSHSADTRTLEIIAGLKAIMEQAVPIYSRANRNPKPNDNIRMWHSYAARANLSGELVYVKLVVREMADGLRVIDAFHDASATPEKEVRANHTAPPHPLSMQGAAKDSPDADTLLRWYHSVNLGQ